MKNQEKPCYKQWKNRKKKTCARLQYFAGLIAACCRRFLMGFFFLNLIPNGNWYWFIMLVGVARDLFYIAYHACARTGTLPHCHTRSRMIPRSTHKKTHRLPHQLTHTCLPLNVYLWPLTSVKKTWNLKKIKNLKIKYFPSLRKYSRVL